MTSALLLALGLPLLLLTALTLWLSNSRHRLPRSLAQLADHSGTIWISGIVLITSLAVVRQLLNR